MQKCIVLKHRIFSIFSSNLAPFWKPKIIEKSQFFDKIEVRTPPLKQYRFEAAFRMDFEALGARFPWILEPLDGVF